MPSIARLRSLSNSALSIVGRRSASASSDSISALSFDRNCALAVIASRELPKPMLPPAPSTVWANCSALRLPAPFDSISPRMSAVPSLPGASASAPPRTAMLAAISGTSLRGISSTVAPLSRVMVW